MAKNLKNKKQKLKVEFNLENKNIGSTTGSDEKTKFNVAYIALEPNVFACESSIDDVMFDSLNDSDWVYCDGEDELNNASENKSYDKSNDSDNSIENPEPIKIRVKFKE